MIPYTLNDTGITFFLKGQRTFARDFPRFEDLKAAVIAGDVAALDLIVNAKQVIARVTAGRVIITMDDDVLFNGQSVPEYLAARILEHLAAGEPIEPLCAFAEKLMSNPNLDVRNDLYKWVENGKMPIYADGDFMAYKRVSMNYTPLHTGGKYGQSQKIGEVVEQPRETCDENRGNTCSSGLHFCSYSYLPQFHGNTNSRIIVLKINPRDVTSIPTDYNLSKGRTCRFEVVDEVPFDEIEKVFGEKMVLTSLGTYQPEDDHEGYASGDEPVVETSVPSFTNKLGITAEEVWGALEIAGGVLAQAAKLLGVGRSTLAEWVKKIGKEAPTATIAIENHSDDDSWGEDSWWSEEPVDNYLDLGDATPLTTEEKLGDQAREALETHGSQTKAAAALGISRSTLARRLKW